MAFLTHEIENIVNIGCEHLFHKNCIVEWGKYKQDCPTCRHPIETKRRFVRAKRKKTNPSV